MVDESSEAPGLRGGVNAAKGSENVVATQALLGLGNWETTGRGEIISN